MWAAKEGRILLTHDVKMMSRYANERIAAQLPVSGIIEVNKEKISIGQAVEELLMLIGASDASEWENRVIYLPLR